MKEGFSYRVDKHHALVLKAQELSQEVEVAFELCEKPVDLRLLDLDNERLGTVDALS